MASQYGWERGHRPVHPPVCRRTADGGLRTAPDHRLGARGAARRRGVGRARPQRRGGVPPPPHRRVAAAVVGHRLSRQHRPPVRSEVSALRRAHSPRAHFARQPLADRGAPVRPGARRGARIRGGRRHRAHPRRDRLLRPRLRERLPPRPPGRAGVRMDERERPRRRRHPHGQPLGRRISQPRKVRRLATADVRARHAGQGARRRRASRRRRLHHGLQQPALGKHRPRPRPLSLQRRLLPRPLLRRTRLRTGARLRALPVPRGRHVHSRPLH